MKLICLICCQVYSTAKRAYQERVPKLVYCHRVFFTTPKSLYVTIEQQCEKADLLQKLQACSSEELHKSYTIHTTSYRSHELQNVRILRYVAQCWVFPRECVTEQCETYSDHPCRYSGRNRASASALLTTFIATGSNSSL